MVYREFDQLQDYFFIARRKRKNWASPVVEGMFKYKWNNPIQSIH
jgi:hypothetical protein